jgi:5'-nucleotidase
MQKAILTVAVSSRSLFHMEDGNVIFERDGQEAYNQYMREKENAPLRPGSAFKLVKKLLELNKILLDEAGNPLELVDVVMLSRNSPDAGLRVMNSIQHFGLPISRAVFCQGAERFRYAKAMNAQLFLSATPHDVKKAIEHGLAAATMRPMEDNDDSDDGMLRIAFDGDSVLFSSEADDTYRSDGLMEFQRSEVANAHVPLGAGPFKKFLEALHEVQKLFPPEKAPIKVALVTARGMPAHARPLRTLRHWGIRIDEAMFAAGLPKGPLLEAFGPHIFFDDTQRNVDSALSCDVVGAHVPFGTGHGIVGTDTKVVPIQAADTEAPAQCVSPAANAPALKAVA